MRKQQAIHLHGLVDELRGHIQETHELPVEAGDGTGPSVSPNAIHRRKQVHEEAVKRSLTAIVNAIESGSVESGDADGRNPATSD